MCFVCRLFKIDCSPNAKRSSFYVFQAGCSVGVVIDFYNNPQEEVPDYKSMNSLLLYVTFVSEGQAKDKESLMEAGAYLISDEILEVRSHLVMLRARGFCDAVLQTSKEYDY